MNTEKPHELTANTLAELSSILTDGSFAPASVDAIDLRGTLDLVPHHESLATLRLIGEKLKDRGSIILSVTDFDRVVESYKSGEGDPEKMLCGEQGQNRAIFNRSKICDLLNAAGFEIIGGIDSLSWTEIPNRITVRAVKRKRPTPTIPLKGVHAIMSLPRIAWTDTFSHTLNVCSNLQMPFTKSTGVFWGQCLQRLMEARVAAGDKYILTIDYDSIFDDRDVVRLWQIMEDNPDIGALCPLQIGRDRDSVLVNLETKDGARVQTVKSSDFYAEAVDIRNGHFGLTMIRCSALAELPKPWFLGVPSASGQWEEGRVDDDIYFWHKFQDAGHRICLSPKVRIGHLQLVITWAKDDLSRVHQYVGEYHKEGRPDSCMTY